MLYIRSYKETTKWLHGVSSPVQLPMFLPQDNNKQNKNTNIDTQKGRATVD